MIQKCPICDQAKVELYLKDIESVYSDKPYSVFHCQNCDHYFTNPLPTSKALGNIYANKYSYAAHSLINPEKKMRAARYADYVATLGVNNVLEIGCMHGLLLIELERNNIKAQGIEPDADAVKHCRSLGLDVTKSSLEEFIKKQPAKKYDAIIMSHVLEHIVEPKNQIDLLKKHLNKNGHLIIIVPNSNARTRKLFGRYWGYWQVPIHINHFNGKSITWLLKNSGFEVDNIKYVGADSLFFLSTTANRLGAKNESHNLSLPKKVVVKVSSVVLRPWYHLGSEDMVVDARVHGKK